MANDRYSRGQVRSCLTCVHYRQAQMKPPFASNCKERFKAWYTQRGYGPCPHYAESPLGNDDYE